MGNYISKPLDPVTTNRIRETCMISSGIPQSLKDYNIKMLAMDLRRMGIPIKIKEDNGADMDTNKICDNIKKLYPNIDEVCMLPKNKLSYEESMKRIIEMANILNDFFGIKIVYKDLQNKALPPQNICQQMYAVMDKVHDRLNDNIDLATKKLKSMRETLENEVNFINKSYTDSIKSLNKAVAMDDLGNFSSMYEQVVNKVKNNLNKVSDLYGHITEQQNKTNLVYSKYFNLRFPTEKINNDDRQNISNELANISTILITFNEFDASIKKFNNLETSEKKDLITKYMDINREFIKIFKKYFIKKIDFGTFKMIVENFHNIISIIYKYCFDITDSDIDNKYNNFALHTKVKDIKNLSTKESRINQIKIKHETLNNEIVDANNGEKYNKKNNFKDLIDGTITSYNLGKSDFTSIPEGLLSNVFLFTFNEIKDGYIVDVSEDLLLNIGLYEDNKTNNALYLKDNNISGGEFVDSLRNISNDITICDQIWTMIKIAFILNYKRYSENNLIKMYGGKKTKKSKSKGKKKTKKSKDKKIKK